MNCGKHLSGRNCWLMVLAVVGLLSVMWAQAGLADTQQGQAPTTLRADLNTPGNPVAVGWVESNFPESATVHLTGALPNTDFVLTSQYWTGTAACGSPDSGGVGYTGSLRTDGSGNGVGQFLYTGWSNAQHQPIPGPPEGISLINWGVGHWIGPGNFDYQWDYWSPCVTVPTVAEFASMNAQAMMLMPKGTANDTVGIVSTFKLGTSSNGIDPATQPVKIDIGSLSLTLPPGSFTKTWPRVDIPWPTERHPMDGATRTALGQPLRAHCHGDSARPDAAVNVDRCERRDRRRHGQHKRASAGAATQLTSTDR